MRTTMNLDNDAMEAVHAYARSNRVSLGKAASELLRRGSRYRLAVRKVNGIPVFEAPDEFPLITVERVRELADEE